jgi:hypothetical protein
MILRFSSIIAVLLAASIFMQSRPQIAPAASAAALIFSPDKFAAGRNMDLPQFYQHRRSREWRSAALRIPPPDRHKAHRSSLFNIL